MAARESPTNVTARSGLRERDLATILVGPDTTVGQPKSELERRIADRLERALAVRPCSRLVEFDDEIAQRPASPSCDSVPSRAVREAASAPVVSSYEIGVRTE